MKIEKNKKLCWIGLKPFDVQNSKIDQSFLFYGKSKNIKSIESEYNERQNYNRPNKTQTEFLNNSIQFAEKNNFYIIAHNPQMLINYKKQTGSKYQGIIGNLKQSLVKNLQSKLYIQELFKNKVPFIKTIKIKKQKCNIKNLKNILSGNKFVIHCSNPFIHDDLLLTKESEPYLKNLIIGNDVLVNKYLENAYTISQTCAISQNQNYLFTPCLDEYINISDSFSHVASNFIKYNSLTEEIKLKIAKYSNIICKVLKQLGWKGVFGIEFLISNKKVFLSKISTTFQATTSILNYSLNQNNLPSLQEIHLSCFTNNKIVDPQKLNININYFCFVIKNKKGWPTISEKPLFIFDKTYNSKTNIQSGAYLYTCVFDKEMKY